jgi:3-oxoacyl-[acyl-carrier protein] reductase
VNILSNKVALVTGASRGIGAGIATHLAAAGATVVVNYCSNKTAAEQVVQTIRTSGGAATLLQGDFSKAEDIARTFAAIRAKHDRLDILVNNAGIFKFNSIENLTPEEFHAHFDLNVLGMLLSIKEATKLMGPDGGSIINIGSIVSTMSLAYTAVYSASKGAVDSLTTALSKELGPRNIRVNSLNPGGVDTDGIEQPQTVGVPSAIDRTPLGRNGLPADIARVAVFLASPDSYWITGQHIVASGGMTM